MIALPEPVEKCFEAAKNLAYLKLPYKFGGGHPTGPSTSYDCSGWVSDILRHGGILESTNALDTKEFLEWGNFGIGKYMTVWVINDPPVLEHCLMEFRIPGFSKMWSMAAHTGTICGWWNLPEDFIKGYTPRRRK